MAKTIKGPEDLEIRPLLKSLRSKKGMERKKARKMLVEKGDKVIGYLTEMVDHPNHIYRWEALQILKELGNPFTIPLFIRALEDDESDIRWIAAEGLIKLGVQSVKPLLNALIEKSDTIFILTGAHHVFYDLKKNKELPTGFPINKLLKELKHPESLECNYTAYEILNNNKFRELFAN